jgi:hypothetical protein
VGMEDLLQENIDKIKRDTEDIIQKDNIEELLKNNSVEFEYRAEKFRIKKPSFEQKLKVNQEKIKKYISMLKDNEILLEKDLILLYEKRGVSIKELDDKFNALKNQKNDYAKKLGKALAEKKSNDECEPFVKEIKILDEELKDIIIKKSVLLDSSLESQLNVYVYTYLGYLITEKYVKGKDLGEGNKEPDLEWVNAWSSYSDFIKEDEDLVNIIVWYTTFFSKDEIPLL